MPSPNELAPLSAIVALRLTPSEGCVLHLSVMSFKPSNESETIAREALIAKTSALLRAL